MQSLRFFSETSSYEEIYVKIALPHLFSACKLHPWNTRDACFDVTAVSDILSFVFFLSLFNVMEAGFDIDDVTLAWYGMVYRVSLLHLVSCYIFSLTLVN